MDDTQKLRRLQARRRGHLKAAVRKYAKVFHMTAWIGKRNEGSARVEQEYPGMGELLINAATEEQRLKPRKMLRLDKFEECGTTCCLYGLDYMRSGRKIEEFAKFYGFRRDAAVCYSWNWPPDAGTLYYTSRDKEDYNGMSEAACMAIDHFALK